MKRSRFVFRTWHVSRVRRYLLLMAAGVVLAATGTFWASAEAHANPPGFSCQTTSGIWLFKGTRRDLCDSAIRPDGSWTRLREFYTPAHNVPLTTYCSGGIYYSSCSTSGGYFQPMVSNGVENYVVFPDNVLPDEPGHLGEI